MMGPVCWSLTLPLLLGATQDALPAGWVKHAPAPGRYTVAMPMKPKETPKKITTATATLDTVVAVAEGRLDSYFVVSYTDYPPKELKADSIDQRLDQGAKAAVENAGGKLRGAMKEIKLDGHPGREIVIEKDGEVIAKMRLYLVDRRLYQVMVLGSAPIFAAKGNDVGVFFDSFRLIK
jgi:hypothetical protein